MELAAFKEDPDKQSEGTPIYIEDATFYVRRLGTPESLKVRKKLRNRLFGPIHKHQDSDEAELNAHWLAEYGVTGWENVFDVGGKPVEYSMETARDIFTDESYWLSLNEKLILEALRFENYLWEEAEDSIEDIKKP